MKRTQAAIASLLKPVDDTRMYEKLGLSMAETNKYEVNIIGFDSKNISNHPNIHFHPLKTFSRLSFARIIKPFEVFKKYLQLKPSIIVINTHDLLLVTVLYKILFGGKIIYDIRENYKANLLYTPVFPSYLKPFLAAWVRGKEWFSRPWIDHYTLAERAYQKQLPFIGKEYTIIENKYKPLDRLEDQHTPVQAKGLKLLVSGTLSASNGLFDAIDISDALYAIDQNVQLQLVGRCVLTSERAQLTELMQSRPYISLIGGVELVPHQQVINAIAEADFGLVFKKSNQGVNDEKILTRLYEYVALGLPMLILPLPQWLAFCRKHQAALPLDPQQFEAQDILSQMKTKTFYTQGDKHDVLWTSEAGKWLQVLDNLVAKNH